MPDGERLRVVVVDDHQLVRQGTRDILERDPAIEVVGDAATGEEALTLVGSLCPDVVLMDIGLPGMSGVDATRAICAARPCVKVLALTIHGDDEYVFKMLEAGAAGYLLKDVRDRELIDAVHAVAAGAGVLDPAVTTTVLGRLRAGTAGAAEPTHTAETLTCREADILRLVADGMDNREIAAGLGLSPRTVEVHLSHAFRKLGARSRTDAVMAAIRLGVVQVAET